MKVYKGIWNISEKFPLPPLPLPFTLSPALRKVKTSVCDLFLLQAKNFLTGLTVTPSEYVAGEFTVQHTLGAGTGQPSVVFAPRNERRRPRQTRCPLPNQSLSAQRLNSWRT